MSSSHAYVSHQPLMPLHLRTRIPETNPFLYHRLWSSLYDPVKANVFRVKLAWNMYLLPAWNQVTWVLPPPPASQRTLDSLLRERTMRSLMKTHREWREARRLERWKELTRNWRRDYQKSR